ncbi:MAM and LDL-receptor class A domain-containing protein 2 [Liparis tanakae]|uniref:MAM and LDL-receptor class A domain-containing protein 2 n=1 Tax=Liparis tanakae TaxID=230148 RepID=A0A4Z2GQT1_9TELE|nr:MAM and LDL-receptor class A domain-containing protein 2 [Liparis tanakae]
MFPPGFYLYVDSSVGEWGDLSFLISDVFQPTTRGHCLTFWYHMYGNKIGTLRVYINDRKTHSGGNEEGILKWIETGNQGAMWQEASVTVKHGEAFWVITSSGLFHQNGFRYIYTSILIVVLYMLCCFILLLRYMLEGSILLKAPLFK